MKIHEDWVLVYSSADRLHAHILASILQEHHLQTILLNKQDSSYQLFGNYEIFVPEEEMYKARQIIHQNELS